MIESLSNLVAHYGYLCVFIVVLVGSAGVPLPASELLVAAAVFAAHTHRLNINLLTGGAMTMAVAGGLLGYALGRSLGAASLARHGAAVGLDAARLRLGRYLFIAHGGKIVFLLRFVALLGPFAGVLAGVNRMPLPRFIVFNTLGGVVWATIMALGGYVFGSLFAFLDGPIGFVALAAGVLVVGVLLTYLHRQGATLQAKADAMLLGNSTGG
jgi:membrane protein DedA with SNARE-associated domain